MSLHRSGRRAATLTLVGLIALGLMALSACQSEEEPTAEEPEPVAEAPPPMPAEKAEEPLAAEEPEPPPETMQEPEREPTPPEPSEAGTVDYSETVWATGKEGVLMRGLDGGLYEPYRPIVVEEVQRELKTRGFYDGPISGVVDDSTMQALGEFQKQNGLQVCGVPTPQTRAALLEASEKATT